MCLVEVEKAPKPIASCAYPVADGMKVFTDTAVVRKARRGVMEFLLINHPLDCPICDQGGECDLQDQAVAYGHGPVALRRRQARGEGQVHRPAGQDDHDPLHPVHALRPLLPPRSPACPNSARTNRGENMEIGTYVEKALTTELSGNLIDICPVGALTSRGPTPSSRGRGSCEDRQHRRAGRDRREHPRRRARAGGAAHPAAHQRRRERGMDGRPRPLLLRRAEAPAARPALGEARRQAGPGDLGRGLRRDRGAAVGAAG